MVSRAITVGFLPRVPIRRDFCTATGLAYEHTGPHAEVCAYAQAATEHYRKWNPELYASHSAVAEEVDAGWRIEGTPFTSGIVNKNSALPYHFDSGNFKDVWSAMLVFKRNVGGGHLCVPALRVAFDCPHNSLFGFDGQGLLHGVTPIRLTHPDGVRYSIVFYSLAHMWDCLPPGKEIERFRERRTKRERTRLARERKIHAVVDLKYQPRFPVYVLLPPQLDVVRAGAALVLIRSGIQPTLVGTEADCQALIRRIGGKYRQEARYLVAGGHDSMDLIARTTVRDVALEDARERGFAFAWLVDAHTKRWEVDIPDLGYTLVTPNALFERGEKVDFPLTVARRKGAPRVEFAHALMEVPAEQQMTLEGCYAA